jgi:hypothetical protein
MGPLGGTAIIAAGVLLCMLSALLWLDFRGITTRFYRRTVKEWGRVPFLGEAWAYRNPYARFHRQTLGPGLFGLLLIVMGIYVVVG